LRFREAAMNPIFRVPCAATLIAALAFHAAPAIANERILGRCEGCEAVFDGRPAALTSRARIAPEGSAGDSLVVEGSVKNSTGAPVAGVIIYVYQTDHKGLYPANPALRGASARHGLYRGFAVTDAMGRYAFDTIRPAGYPGTDLPQHIHMHIVEPGRCTYYIDDIVFDDDPRLNARQRANHLGGRGGSGLAIPVKRDGAWRVTRDIELGKGIREYNECGKP
jgi:protocatechuate 3,4-dioxygenase beta subunit